MIKHLMIDLETWGKLPGCAVRSIGGIIFDPHSDQQGSSFYANIDDTSCFASGLTVDPETRVWWEKQSEVSQSAFRDPPPKPLVDVVDSFNRWCYIECPEAIWAHGINFDEPIWRFVTEAVGRTVLWSRHVTRDTRTLFALADFDFASMPNSSKHYALADARIQAEGVQRALRLIGPSSVGLQRLSRGVG